MQRRTCTSVACDPQAWAAVTPFALIQACLGLEVDGAAPRPRLPHFLDWMTIKRLRIGPSSVELMIRRHDSSVAVSLPGTGRSAEVEVLL